MPCTVPSSPGVPCSALNTTSGLTSPSRAATLRSMSIRVTRWPRLFERVGDAVAGHQRDFPLGRPAAHQHRDMQLTRHHSLQPSGFPIPASRRCPPARAAAPPRPDSSMSRRARPAEIEQEVAMLLRDLRLADRQAPAAGRVDQLPGLGPRRILEGRAAGPRAQRLRGLARGGDAVHLRLDRVGIAGAFRGSRAATTMAPSGSSEWR